MDRPCQVSICRLPQDFSRVEAQTVTRQEEVQNCHAVARSQWKRAQLRTVMAVFERYLPRNELHRSRL